MGMTIEEITGRTPAELIAEWKVTPPGSRWVWRVPGVFGEHHLRLSKGDFDFILDVVWPYDESVDGKPRGCGCGALEDRAHHHSWSPGLDRAEEVGAAINGVLARIDQELWIGFEGRTEHHF